MARKRNVNPDISNDELSAAIDKWVRGQRERNILKRNIIDNVPFERIAEERGLSTQWTKQLFGRGYMQLTGHI